MRYIIENELIVHQFEQGGGRNFWWNVIGFIKHLFAWFKSYGTFYMRKGQIVAGHAHNFGHATFVHSGTIKFDVLNVLTEDLFGRPLTYEIEKTAIIHATDELNFFYTEAGRWHQLTALEDWSRYGCHAVFRKPTCLTIHRPGQLEHSPKVRIDAYGQTWVLLDESIANVTKDTAEWPPSWN